MGVEAPVSIKAFEAAPLGRVSPAVNEGPVGPDFRLEDTMPLTFNKLEPIGEIRFNPDQTPGTSPIPEVFIEAFNPQVTAVVEHPDVKARKIWEELRSQESLTPEMAHRAFLAAAAVGKSPQYLTSVLQGQKSVEVQTKGLDKQTGTFHTQQALKEKAYHIFEHRTHKISNLSGEQDHEVKKKRFVLDEHALGQRIVEITQAVRKAKQWAQELGIRITGPLITRFFPGQHPGNESEAVKGRGLDGSIPETIDGIENYGQFTSEYDAEQKSIKTAYEKPPVKVRREGEGKRVKDEDVYRVFQRHAVKPVSDELDLSESLTATKVEEITEPRIEDYPDLAEVFDH